MMKTLRTNMKTILWLVVVAFLGTIFVVWGMKGEYAFRSPQTLAIVNGEEITYSEFYPVWNKQLDMYREIYKDKFTDKMTEDIKTNIINSLVMQKLLLQTAKKMKIEVSIEEIVKKIKQYPVFLNKDGSFNEEKYRETIKSINVPWTEIEKEERNNLIIEKLRNLIVDSIKVSDEEIKYDYIITNKKKEIDEEKFNKEKESLRLNLKGTKSWTIYSEWIKELQNKAKIKILSENIKNI